MPSHISFVEPLPPEWPSCRPIFAAELVCTKSVTRRHDACCVVGPQSGAPGRDPALGETHTISVITRPAPPSALPPRCTRWKSEVQAVVGDVLVHRRDHDPVDELELPDARGLEHRRDRSFGGRRAHVLREPRVASGHELRIAQSQVVVGDPAAARHDVEAELQRVLVDVLVEVLEPLQAGLRGALGGEHHGLALGLVRRQRGVEVRLLVQARGQGEGVLHGQLGAGADREVRGVGGVAEETTAP